MGPDAPSLSKLQADIEATLYGISKLEWNDVDDTDEVWRIVAVVEGNEMAPEEPIVADGFEVQYWRPTSISRRLGDTNLESTYTFSPRNDMRTAKLTSVRSI